MTKNLKSRYDKMLKYVTVLWCRHEGGQLKKKFFENLFLPLHARDYLKKTSVKINVATDEGNSRNEIGHWANDQIGVAVQSWL